MAVDEERIRAVYDKTGGRCRCCDKQLSIANYGTRGEHGAWAIDHSRPVSKGGTDHMNNLFPACYDCNEEKDDQPGDSFLRRKQESGRPSSSQGDCFVATAACDREDGWVVQSLRTWRDTALIPTRPGRLFVSLYYQIGPVLARLVRRSAIVREIVKPVLRRIAGRTEAVD